MKIRIANDKSVRKPKNKELFVETILEKMTSLMKNEPRLFLKRRLARLDKTESFLKKKDRKFSSILEKAEDMKKRINQQISYLDSHNLKERSKLMKKLGMYEKGKSENENNRTTDK